MNAIVCRLTVLALLAGFVNCSRLECGEKHLLRERGAISSPYFPHIYTSPVECTWIILKPPNSQLTIFIMDFSVLDDDDCPASPCCSSNYLALPEDDGDTLVNYCGKHKPKGPIHRKKNHTIIKYKSSGRDQSKGFSLTYVIAPLRNSVACRTGDFHCEDKSCIPATMQCDGVIQCADGSDELNCPNDCTLKGKVPCDLAYGTSCFDNTTQRCNGVEDCPSGIDEYNCTSYNCEHKCHLYGCFSSSQRCDGIQHCLDFTDELGCGSCKSDHARCSNFDDSCFLPSLHQCDGINHCPNGEDEVGCGCNDVPNCFGIHCIGTTRQCSNLRCVHSYLWCNGNDDCGDNSDEENCIKTSFISAAIMACLFCGLMLVITVMCALRLYSTRHEVANYRLPLPQHIATRLSLTSSISLPVMDEEFFHREPPPAYSVAIGHIEPNTPGIVDVDFNTRRSRTRRHQSLQPLVKPPTPPLSSETSNQSSPSRDSITSSSYLSNDDSAHLIGT